MVHFGMTLVTIENKVICQEFGHNYVMLPKHKADVSKLNSVYECSFEYFFRCE